MSSTRKEGAMMSPLVIALLATVLRVATLATLAVMLGGTTALARCIGDRSRSLQDMVTGAQSWFETEIPVTNKALQDAIAKGHPWSSAIPKDFRIDPRRTPFTVSTLVGPTNVYWLPSTDLGARNIGFGIGSSWKTYRDVAECRVQAPDGRWWLALRQRGGDLSYVPEDQTEPSTHR